MVCSYNPSTKYIINMNGRRIGIIIIVRNINDINILNIFSMIIDIAVVMVILIFNLNLLLNLINKGHSPSNITYCSHVIML